MSLLRNWYLYEIALWLHAGSLLRNALGNRLKCHLLQPTQACIYKSFKVSLIAVNNIIVVTYYSKCHRLSLSLIAVNGITLIG